VTINDVTVCIPSIPPRAALLRRAVDSVLAQDMPVNLSVYVDREKRGAAYARDQALTGARTRWVAFLDDDDVLDPGHVRKLLSTAVAHGAGYVWSRFRIGYPFMRPNCVGTPQPGDYATQDGPAPLGAGTFQQWNDEQPAQTTVTTLVRRDVALDVGGYSGKLDRQNPGTIGRQRAGEDWLFTLACRELLGREGMRHHPEVTWTWMHHDSNTSGRPDRW
jgi:hypothetical protein